MLVKKPAVIGAGTMGLGIAEVLAAAGYQVQVVEVSATAFSCAMERSEARWRRQVERGKVTAAYVDELRQRIQPCYQIEELSDVDMVIEAIHEDLAVKKELFQRLDRCTPPAAILASNTSSLSITAIAANTTRPERVLGLHFFNPAPQMPLVEVVRGAETDAAVLEQMVAWMRELGKEPVTVADTPGFLVNRVARPFHLEAYRMLSDGVASKEQIDEIMEAAGFKMGPFRLQDMIGIDINYNASCAVYEGFFHEPRFRPHPHQRQMVERNALGRKTKKGHYVYE